MNMAKKQKTPDQAALTVNVTVEDPGALFFREGWSDGQLGKEKFELSRSVNAAAIHFAVGSGMKTQTYTLSVDALVKAFLTVHEGRTA